MRMQKILYVIVVGILVYAASSECCVQLSYRREAPPEVIHPTIQQLLSKTKFVTYPEFLDLFYKIQMLSEEAQGLPDKKGRKLTVKANRLLSTLKDKYTKYTLTKKHYALLKKDVDALEYEIRK